MGGSDYLPHSIWAKKFLEAQGYVIKENTFYQDNQSAIRFAKNGRKSCGQKSKHIDIRYFFIKDRLEIEGYTVEYCPTQQMLADFFTKPLQGNLFRRLSAVVMGHKHVDSLKEITLATSQERVEDRACASIADAKSVTFADEGQTDGYTSVTGEPTKLNKKPTYAQVAKRRLDRVG